MLGGGAGIQSAQLMADRGVKTVLTGNCGPNAHQTLSAADIEVLIAHVAAEVERLHGVRLQTEVHMVGEPA